MFDICVDALADRGTLIVIGMLSCCHTSLAHAQTHSHTHMISHSQMFDTCVDALADRGTLIVIGMMSAYGDGWKRSSHEGLAEK